MAAQTPASVTALPNTVAEGDPGHLDHTGTIHQYLKQIAGDINTEVAAVSVPASNKSQTLNHAAAGVLNIDMSLGHSLLVNASANITGFTWSTHPGFGAVAGIWFRNVGSSTVSIDITAGFRSRPGDTLAALSLEPGGVLFVTATGDHQAWTTAAPFLRDADYLDYGTSPAIAGVSFFDAWSISFGTGQNTVATTAPANSAGKTGLLVISGTGGQDSGGVLTGWTFVDRFLSGASDMIGEIYKRDMTGAAEDAPTVGGGAIRAVSISVLSGTTAAKLAPANAWLVHPSATSFTPASVTTTLDASLIVTYGVGRFATRTYTGPSNMLTAFNAIDTNARGHMMNYKEVATASSFAPNAYTVTSGSSTDFMTRSLVATP